MGAPSIREESARGFATTSSLPGLGSLIPHGFGSQIPNFVATWLLITLSYFYRESLARLLALERYRNLIKTNITAGITLYTDHKPGLFENSLSNKGQLSAWRLLETADLLSIVENLYRTGGKILVADPLSRLCAPSNSFYDVTLPSKSSHATKQPATSSR